MVSFELAINGKRVRRAGIPGDGMLLAMVHWLSRRRPDGRALPELFVELSGFRSDVSIRGEGAHHRWPRSELKVGDSVTIRILETNRADKPTAVLPSFSKAQLKALEARDRKRRLKRMKQVLFDVRAEIERLESELNIGQRRPGSARRRTRKT